ncbi:condensation domain-containing protein [Limosilactobacillus sp.]|uniref:condensation domain-containing protein n=1 Tax=Limosilactobacillus sp. TaxID=2773925 RepID=UPI0025BEB18C|nr:condensation domain-containing protein [Limosilactobacillus sp.]MCH3923006.1 condensation domain-containing protein [Limosilactobacillus sp.]MCH3927689.1 condensation domain-containing protein [Limosilactobacillus sp.]
MAVYRGNPLNILHTIGMDELYPIVRIHFVLTGNFDLKRFQAALLACGRAIPELFCKYVLADNSFVTVTDDLTGVLFQGIDPDADWAKWDLFCDPQLRVYLNQVETGQDVTIYLSHILTDGAGAKQFMTLLARAYNGDDLSTVENHTDIDWLHDLLAQHPVEVKKGADHPADPLTMPQLADSHDQHYRTGALHLDEEFLSKLIKAGHATGVTLNDLFMAAYGQAVQRFSATEQISLACPTDMRKFIPGSPELRVANHTSRYNISVASDPQAPFATAVQAVHRAMAANKEQFQCLESVKTLVDNYANYSLAQLQQICEENYHVRTISYTNFGIVDKAKFHFAGCQVTDFDMLGSYRRAPMFQVAVSTYDGQLILAYAMLGNDEEARLGKNVMLIMRDLLTNYALEYAE